MSAKRKSAVGVATLIVIAVHRQVEGWVVPFNGQDKFANGYVGVKFLPAATTSIVLGHLQNYVFTQKILPAYN